MSALRRAYVTYYRVSTERQGRSGLGIEGQRAAAALFLAAQGGAELASFTETESGKLDARPQLEAALLRCRQTKATLLVAKLDRLSRNISFLFRLRDDGVKFQAIDLPEANTLTLGVMASMAQWEREIISARTKAALAARKARGLALGTPRDLSTYQRSAARLGTGVRQARARRFATDVGDRITAARAAGAATLRAVAKFLNSEGCTTPRGKAWTAAAVRSAERLAVGLPAR